VKVILVLITDVKYRMFVLVFLLCWCVCALLHTKSHLFHMKAFIPLPTVKSIPL